MDDKDKEEMLVVANNYSFILPMMKHIVIDDPNQQMVNADLKLVLTMLKAANDIGLRGDKVKSLSLKPNDEGGTTITIDWE